MLRSLLPIALLASEATASYPGSAQDVETTSCESNVMSYETTTYMTKTAFSTETCLVDVTVPHYVNSTMTRVHTHVVEEYVTECITTTLYFTSSLTDTDTDFVTVTSTDSVTITGTEHETLTETDTTTETRPTTTWTTETVFSTTFDPCPTECSISAETVNLYFWPSDRAHSYPTTWIDTSLAYTFTYPSVYMLIPTAIGTNNATGPTGPSTSNWILPLDLTEVSTIVSNTLTQQLSLSDLGTDCPKTIAADAIATMAPNPHCDPILAAPKQVSSWAYPCNACGRFGLFDPPYAAPTLTGPLVLPTTTTTSTAVVEPSSSVVISVPPVPLPSVTDLPSFSVPPAPMPSVTDIPSETAGVSASTSAGVVVPSTATMSESGPVNPIPTASAARARMTMGWLVGVMFVAFML